MSIDLASAQWFKSTHSNPDRACVEIAHLAHGHVGVRDSKDSTSPALIFTPSEWDTFLTSTSTGEFH